MTRTAAFLLTCLMTLISARADEPWMLLKMGQTYHVAEYSYFYGYFTPDEDCTVVLTQNVLTFDLMTKWAPQPTECVLVPQESFSGTGTIGYETTYNVKAGHVYFLATTYALAPVNVSIDHRGEGEARELRVVNVVPAAGATVGSGTNGGSATLDLDFAGEFDSFRITSADGSLATQSYRQGEHMAFSTVSVYFKPALEEFYALEGAGDVTDFTLHLTGLRDSAGNLYDGTGEYAIDYHLGAPAIDLVKSTLNPDAPSPLLNWYEPGTGDGLLSFTFNGAFDPSHTATVYELVEPDRDRPRTVAGPLLMLSCRDESCAKVMVYEGKASDDCCTVTFDISGHDFGDFNGALKPTNPAVFKLSNVYRADGDMARGQTQDSPGAYTFATTYRRYEPLTLNAAFEPGEDATLHDGQPITCRLTPVLNVDDTSGRITGRITGAEAMVFAGTAADGTTVSREVTPEVAAEGDELVFTGAVPEGMADAANLRVSLKGIVSTDGITYGDNLVSTAYNLDLAVISVTFDPAPGRNVTAFGSFTMTTTADYAYADHWPALVCSDPRAGTMQASNVLCSELEGGLKRYTVYLPQTLSLDSALAGSQTVAEGTTVTLTVPRGVLTDGGKPGQALTAVWTISTEESGLEEVTVESGAEAYFTLSGVRLRSKPAPGTVCVRVTAAGARVEAVR